MSELFTMTLAQLYWFSRLDMSYDWTLKLQFNLFIQIIAVNYHFFSPLPNLIPVVLIPAATLQKCRLDFASWSLWTLLNHTTAASISAP